MVIANLENLTENIQHNAMACYMRCVHGVQTGIYASAILSELLQKIKLCI